MNHEGLLRWQVFLLGFMVLIWRWGVIVAWACVGRVAPALESSVPRTWLYVFGPVASDLPRHTSLLWPWAGSLEGVGSFVIRRAGDVSGSVVHLLAETSWFCPSIDSLCFFQLWSCWVVLSSSCVHLLICTSYSVPKLYALKINSHTRSPVLVQLSPSVPKLWLFIEVHNPWNLFPAKSAFSFLNFPIRSKEKEWNRFPEVFSTKWLCTSSYVGGGG